MSSNSSVNIINIKRNRSDNFESEDIDLLLTLVNEYSDLIDSSKLDLKKQGWEAICTKYNANCTGIKRDLNALKMKVKNIKTQTKKTKMEFDTQDPLSDHPSESTPTDPILKISSSGEDANDQDYEEHQINSGGDNSFESKSFIKIRKRCKKFSKPECDLLLTLYDKHCSNLDSSSTPNSVKKRVEAWEALTEEYNILQTFGVTRDCIELKIKIKNIKALRVKTEPNDKQIIGNSHMFSNDSDASVSKSAEDRKPISTRSISILQHQPNDSVSYNNLNNYYDGDDDDDYSMNTINQLNSSNKRNVSEDDKEIEKIRRENVLLKNAVLRKKERLLELQIALAERNLRRQL